MSVLRNKRLVVRLGALPCLTFLMSMFPVTGTPQGTGETIVTNYAVLERISGEAIDELMGNMPAVEKGTLMLLDKERGVGAGIDTVFENELVRRMTDAGLRIATKPAAGEAAERSRFSFSYQIIRFNLQYPAIGRSHWIGAKEVERSAEVGIFARLIDSGSGEIVWVGDTQKKYDDTIAYSILERVEDPQLEFTRPQRNEIRLSRIIEPVVVTGIVVGLVYLFFSNQSGD